MNITLKGLKSFNTDDGQAFSASILFDGKKVGTVQNDGNGGPNSYDLSVANMKLLVKAANAAGEKGLECEDIFIENLLEELDVLKQHKKNLKNGFPVTAWVSLGRFDRGTIRLLSKDNLQTHLARNKATLIKLFEGEVAHATK